MHCWLHIRPKINMKLHLAYVWPWNWCAIEEKKWKFTSQNIIVPYFLPNDATHLLVFIVVCPDCGRFNCPAANVEGGSEYCTLVDSEPNKGKCRKCILFGLWSAVAEPILCSAEQHLRQCESLIQQQIVSMANGVHITWHYFQLFILL